MEGRTEKFRIIATYLVFMILPVHSQIFEDSKLQPSVGNILNQNSEYWPSIESKWTNYNQERFNEEDIFSGDSGITEEPLTTKKPDDETLIISSREDPLQESSPNDSKNEIVSNQLENEENQGAVEETTTMQTNDTPVPLPTADSSSSTTIEDTTLAVELPECLSNGTLPNSNDCHRYYLCSWSSVANSYEALPMACPISMAYNTRFKRCSRDITDCNDGITCDQEARIADPNDNTTYWWCTPSVMGGFHKFFIRCPKDQYFMPVIGKCFYDLQNLPSVFPFGIPKDIDAVKLELKQFKEEEKKRLKAEKLRAKMAKKQQKELEKQAEKDAKAKAKLMEAASVSVESPEDI